MAKESTRKTCFDCLVRIFGNDGITACLLVQPREHLVNVPIIVYGGVSGILTELAGSTGTELRVKPTPLGT